MRRTRTLAVLAGCTLALAACAPRGDDHAADSDSTGDTTAAVSPATASPVIDTAVAATPAYPAAPGAARAGTPPPGDSTRLRDSTPRMKPPSKRPGGTIFVPPSTHDSLRMAPPDTTRKP